MRKLMKTKYYLTSATIFVLVALSSVAMANVGIAVGGSFGHYGSGTSVSIGIGSGYPGYYGYPYGYMYPYGSGYRSYYGVGGYYYPRYGGYYGGYPYYGRYPHYGQYQRTYPRYQQPYRGRRY